VAATYVVLNLVFAIFYVACGPAALAGAGATPPDVAALTQLALSNGLTHVARAHGQP